MAPFLDGVTQASAVVIVRNDAVPEGNETFTVRITGARFGAEVGNRSTMQLIIRANDEPHGAFQFDQVSEFVNHTHGEFQVASFGYGSGSNTGQFK